VSSLGATFGRGAMTNNWVDIKNADVILVMGGNPAENHPCGFKWAIEAKKTRNAKLVCVDPRFNRTAAVSDHFVQIRSGTDIAFLAGVMNYMLANNRIHKEYVANYTNASYLIKEGFQLPGDNDGLFSGFDPQKRAYDKSTWGYDMGPDNYVKVDMTLEDPRCVFQLMKKHYSRYTPEMVASICGCSKEDFQKAAEMISSSYPADKAGTIMYALGWTHHTSAVQNIRAAASMQLLLGNVGRPGGGVNALRGHANIQGATDMNQTHTLPGYLKMPKPEWQTLKDFIEATTPKKLRPNSMNYWENTDKFMVSMLKAFFGSAATAENDFGYSWLPKMDRDYSWVYIYDGAYNGIVKGVFSFGMNPVANGPHSKKMVQALSRLDWLVVAENFETETSSFWKAPKEYDPPPSAQIKTEVFLLPAANFAEKDGVFTNSSRWLQWKWKAVDPPGDAKVDQEIIGRLVLKLKELYSKEGGKLPDPVVKMAWGYSNPVSPNLEEVAKEINGKVLEDFTDEKTKVDYKKGQQVPGYAVLRADGKTLSGNWLHSGYFTEAGNLSQRRNPIDDSGGLGMYHNWAFNWPSNRRVMYNRASADLNGKPWDPKRPGIWWNGEKWVGDVPDYKPDFKPEEMIGPFIMNPEGVGKLYAVDMNDGPFPEHYEPYETPVDNPLHPKVSSNPVTKLFKTNMDVYGKRDKFPIVCTTYRLTEHFHYWTKHEAILNQLQQEFFVEIPEELAAEKGIKNGDRVKVSSARGSVEGKAMVTKRIRPLKVAGKTVWQIGFPIHWGFAGKSVGPLANTLTPTALDPNSSTPEYKAFLVALDKA
jgi:formate dehydrogenase major subunit